MDKFELKMCKFGLKIDKFGLKMDKFELNMRPKVTFLDTVAKIVTPALKCHAPDITAPKTNNRPRRPTLEVVTSTQSPTKG